MSGFPGDLAPTGVDSPIKGTDFAVLKDGRSEHHRVSGPGAAVRRDVQERKAD